MVTETGEKYEIENRELIAESNGLRVQVLTIGPGQCVPWHHHTAITDTFFCLRGPMVVQTRRPDAAHELQPGERLSVPPNQPHTVFTPGDGRCSFVIVQGVGTYDYIPA